MTNTRTLSRQSDAKLRKILKGICKNEPGTLRARIANDALQHGDAVQFFVDVQRFGCPCGYEDTAYGMVLRDLKIEW